MIEIKPLRMKSRIAGYANELLTRLKFGARLRNVERQAPVLVYQMGKVGSSTVVSTLSRLKIDSLVLQVHTLSPANLSHAISRRRHSSSPHLHEHLIVSTFLIRKLADGIFPCHVITLTREPVSRAISFVFEDLKKQAPGAIGSDGTLNHDILKGALDRILSGSNGIADPTIWFETELQARFGIDVFATPYDFDTGYYIIQDDHAPVLVVRMEDLSRAIVPGLADFLKLDANTVEPQWSNVGARKWYADDLRQLKNSYRISPEIAQVVFGTKYFTHFYSHESEKIMERWLG